MGDCSAISTSDTDADDFRNPNEIASGWQSPHSFYSGTTTLPQLETAMHMQLVYYARIEQPQWQSFHVQLASSAANALRHIPFRSSRQREELISANTTAALPTT